MEVNRYLSLPRQDAAALFNIASTSRLTLHGFVDQGGKTVPLRAGRFGLSGGEQLALGLLSGAEQLAF